ILSKKLATIITNVPIDCDIEQLAITSYDHDTLLQLFAEFEFKTLGKRILGQDIPAATTVSAPDLFSGNVDTVTPYENIIQKEISNYKTILDTQHNYVLIDNLDLLEGFVKDAMQQKEICFDTETTNIDAMQASLVGLSFS